MVVDLVASWPFYQADEPLAYYTEPSGVGVTMPEQRYQAPAASLRGQVAATLQLDRWGSAHRTIADVGVAFWSGRFDAEDGAIEPRFSVTRSHLDVGIQLGALSEGPLSAYAGLGGGVELDVLSSSHWNNQIGAAPHLLASAGVAYGSGAARGLLEARLAPTVSFSETTGTMQLATSRAGSSYSSGGALLDLGAGMRFL